MTLGTLNVFFRDVGYFYTVALQFWFWLTPIVYSVNILPERVQDLLQLNPLTNLITAYQTIFVLQEWPNWASLIYISSASLVLILLARYLFIKHAGEMVDLL
jgi:lipopolysaccharide transport system permease protein